MDGPDDWQLIETYARTGSHAAFETLVQRHAGMVYGSARRRVGSPDLADDVTQATFIILARKCRTISRRQSLSAWLYRTSRYVSIDAQRRRRTRQQLEHHAAALRPEAAMPDESLSNVLAELLPHLDRAIDLLPTRDREAILLRFFENQTLEEIGKAQKTAASTVQRRLQQALHRLSHELKRLGVAPAPAALVGALTTCGLAPAPASATLGITAAATATGAVTASTAGAIGLAKGTMNAMNLIKIKLVAAVLVGAVTVGVGGFAITTVIAQSVRPAQSKAIADVAPAGALQIASPSTAPSLQPTFISGVVTLADGATVVPNVNVVASPADGSQTQSRIALGRTDSQGAFVLEPSLPPGDYSIAVAAEGSSIPTKTIAVAPGAGPIGVHLSLPTASMSGTVFNADGTPAAAGTMVVLSTSVRPAPNYNVRTDANGMYHMDHIVSGNAYMLTAYSVDFAKGAPGREHFITSNVTVGTTAISRDVRLVAANSRLAK